MKLANALLLLAIIATASALYLGRRGPTAEARELEIAAEVRSERLSDEVVRLRRELAAMKAQIALLQDDHTEPAAEPQRSGSDSSDE